MMRFGWFHRKRPSPVIGALASLLLTACGTTPPDHLQGEYSPIAPEQTTAGDVGSTVRWGGEVFDRWEEAQQTCLAIVSRELGSAMRPKASLQTQGPFVACASGVPGLEAVAYGRALTLTGSIAGLEDYLLHGTETRLPQLVVESVELWQKFPPSSRTYDRTVPRPVITNRAGPRQ